MTIPQVENTVTHLRILEPISRVTSFCKRHGLRATLRRTVLFAKRLLSSNRMVLFYLDLADLQTGALPADLRVEQKKSPNEIDAKDWQLIINFWNAQLSQRSFLQRFHQGASIWLVWCDSSLAGYGWTVTGKTIEPHYHPFGANDVHLFDFLVFPEFRGRNINPCLVGYILQRLSSEGRTRAYIEVREWNKPQLQSLRKTPFQLLGVARKRSILGRTVVQWSAEKHLPRSGENKSSQHAD